MPAAGGWRGVPAALKSGGRRRSRPGQRNGEGPVRAKGLAEIGMGPGAVKAVTGGLEVLRGGRPWHGGYGAWADGRVLGEGEARVGGHAPQGAPAGGAARRWRKRRLGLHRDLLELRRSRGRRGRRRALGRGRPARAEASTGGRPLGGRATPPRAGAGGGRGATGRGWRRRRGGCRGPGGAGAAKATCPPSRSQVATDRLTSEPSVAPATSTPWRVRIAGSMKGPGARRRVRALSPCISVTVLHKEGIVNIHLPSSTYA